MSRPPTRATSEPLGMPKRAIGSTSAASTTLIRVAEPVVSSTNHGSAMNVIAVPVEETSSAARRATSERSRGAIFNYFASKWEIFFALAQEDMSRIGALWLEQGYDEALRTVAGESPDWLGVYFEVARKFRHDPVLRRQWSQRAPDLELRIVHQISELQRSGTYRGDVSVEEIARFLGVVIDGVVSQASFGEPIDVGGVLKLVRSALVPGDVPK